MRCVRSWCVVLHDVMMKMVRCVSSACVSLWVLPVYLAMCSCDARSCGASAAGQQVRVATRATQPPRPLTLLHESSRRSHAELCLHLPRIALPRAVLFTWAGVGRGNGQVDFRIGGAAQAANVRGASSNARRQLTLRATCDRWWLLFGVATDNSQATCLVPLFLLIPFVLPRRVLYQSLYREYDLAPESHRSPLEVRACAAQHTNLPPVAVHKHANRPTRVASLGRRAHCTAPPPHHSRFAMSWLLVFT